MDNQPPSETAADQKRDNLSHLVPDAPKPKLTPELKAQLRECSPDPRSGKWPKPQALFSARMRREGKADALRARMEELAKDDIAAGGNGHHAIAWRKAAIEFGYSSEGGEKRLAQAFIEEHTPEATPSVTESNEFRKREAFEVRLSKLPEKASEAEELRWIRQHPAMARAVMRKPGAKADSSLRPSDLDDAPSRTAVIELLHWMHHPAKFFEKVNAERMKKHEEEASEKKYDVRVDVAEIETLLAELTGAT